MKFAVCVIVLASLCSSSAFSTLKTPTVTGTRVFSSSGENYDDGNLLNGFKAGFGILRKGLSKGDGFKQSLADALAGPDLDLKAANDRIDAYISKSPVVVFSWTVSGFSKKAKNLLSSIGADFEAVELDQPWSDGNPIRSALGRRIGRTSVPAIFINGVYIGGCDDGPSADAPGLIPLAFQGKLRSMLIEAGSMKADEKVDSGSIIESSNNIVASTTISSNEKKMVSNNISPNEPVVSTTVTENQKLSAPKDKVVSSTVADNLSKTLASLKVKGSPSVVVATPTITMTVAPVVEIASVIATKNVNVVQERKGAKGFYSKKNVVVEDELCPVEEDCEL